MALKPPRTPEDQQKQAALSLLKRLPPQDLEKNLDAFVRIQPNLEQSLAPHINRPLKVKQDTESNRYFIACEYNCDGGTHRSPWSNKYLPQPGAAADELFRPSERLRRLEETFNEVFDAYKTSYYDGGVSSVYLWDLDEGFAGAFLIHKEADPGTRGVELGNWDSAHIVEVREQSSSNSSSYVDYKLSTSVLVHLKVPGRAGAPGETEFSSFVSRQSEDRSPRKKTGEDSHLLHIKHIGRMIEDMEINIRQSMDVVQIAKQREVLNAVHSMDSPDPFGLPQGEKQKKKQIVKGNASASTKSDTKAAALPEATIAWAEEAASKLKAESLEFGARREKAMELIAGRGSRKAVSELHLSSDQEARMSAINKMEIVGEEQQISDEEAARIAREEAELAAEMEKYTKMQLKICIQHADQLKSSMKLTGKDLPDAFCLVRCRSAPDKFWSTSTIVNDANPRWNYEIMLKAMLDDTLDFIVLDKGKLEDKFIGQVELTGDVLFPNGKEGMFPLTDKWEGDCGDLKMKINVIAWEDESFSESKPYTGGITRLPQRIIIKPEETPAPAGLTQLGGRTTTSAGAGKGKQLKVTVISGRNLKNVDNALLGQGVSDPYVIVRFEGNKDSEWSTQVIEDNLNPDWNCAIRLPDFKNGDNLEFIVMDKDRFKDDMIGECKLACCDYFPDRKSVV